MAKIFDTILVNKPNKNAFDLSHERKMSMNMGDLVPCFVQEVIPGDKFKVNMEHLIRFQPLLAPIMHRVNVYTHFFFVPNRIIWNEFEKFITGGEDGQQEPVFPRLYGDIGNDYDTTPFKTGSLADYLGIPCTNYNTGDNPVNNFSVSALPFRAYQLIYNEYYRDQNLTPPIEFSKGSGYINPESADWVNLLNLRKRAWEKDYFTSALPWAQRGTELTIPTVSGYANVISNETYPKFAPGPLSAASPIQQPNGILTNGLGESLKFSNSGLKTDLTNAPRTSINELRQAFQIQKWLEKSARGGARYIEQILSHFGIKSSDARLQRPEYLGGGKTPVIISEVLQTSATESGSAQGNMAGHGISVGNTNSFVKSFEEHGIVLGIMSILPRTSYQNGLPRIFRKYDKFDYYWPDFAHLGEQAVYNRELFLKYDTLEGDDTVFGYQPRYSEYRYCPDTVHGDFKGNLDYWHMGRKFTAEPALNTSFVTSDPTSRIFAVTDPSSHKLLVQTYCNFQAIRPVSKFGTPAGI